jgi:GAF domain-containing protein
MYTQRNGSFAKVPMGAFKVGKIAQNGIPFLSNALADETWVRDREWAIAKGIRGFAGYPLTAGGDVVGVLAVFSQQAMAPEFLEVLQSLCATVAIALELALHYQQEKQAWQQEKQARNAPKLDATNRQPAL